MDLNNPRDMESSQIAKEDRQVHSLVRVDGKWKALFRVNSLDWETRTEYEKIFDTDNEFLEFAHGFFDIGQDK